MKWITVYIITIVINPYVFWLVWVPLGISRKDLEKSWRDPRCHDVGILGGFNYSKLELCT